VVRTAVVLISSVAVLAIVGYVGYLVGGAMGIGGSSDPTTVQVTKGLFPDTSYCVKVPTTALGDVGPDNSGCASIEIGLDGKCVVDFPVTESARRAFATYCPKGIRER